MVCAAALLLLVQLSNVAECHNVNDNIGGQDTIAVAAIQVSAGGLTSARPQQLYKAAPVSKHVVSMSATV